MVSVLNIPRLVARRVHARRAIDVVSGKEPYRSTWNSLGLRRDLQVPFTAPDAKIPICIRCLTDRDIAALFDTSDPALSPEECELRNGRRELAEAGIGTGFVAVTETDESCYVQWLMGPADNDRIAFHFKGTFPLLKSGEALLEGAYTPESHRGKGIMPAAMARIAEFGPSLGAHAIITFVTDDNVPSLKGCARAGFNPYIRRIVTWHGLRRSVHFEAI